MTMGAADKKKVIALAVLGAFAAYMVYSNLLSGPPGSPPDSTARTTTAPAAPAFGSAVEQSVGPQRTRARNEEFHPILHSKRPEDRVDPMKLDPTLRMDLLAKVMDVEAAGGSRNLFAFGQPPPKVVEDLKGKGPQVATVHYGPDPVKPPEPPKPVVEPAPPPITLKFYGFSTVRNNGRKSAYFLDGDCAAAQGCEILIASEGETLKRRYKLVRISPSSVLVEDTESKRQQSVPLTQEAPVS